jgi:hypothetical protein
MFKIVLQPDEAEALRIVRDGLHAPGLPEHPVLVKLLALGMLAADEQGNLQVTPLAEAALARMEGAIH